MQRRFPLLPAVLVTANLPVITYYLLSGKIPFHFWLRIAIVCGYWFGTVRIWREALSPSGQRRRTRDVRYPPAFGAWLALFYGAIALSDELQRGFATLLGAPGLSPSVAPMFGGMAVAIGLLAIRDWHRARRRRQSRRDDPDAQAPAA